MLKIKLARFGKRNQPHYRIVVNRAKDKRDGQYVAQVGHYAPAQSPKILVIDVKEYQAWLGKGAQPTDTVAALFKRYQSGDPFPVKQPKLSRKAKAKLEKPKEEAKPAVEVAPEPAEPSASETPAEAETETPAAEEPVAAETVEPAAEETVAEEKAVEEEPATEASAAEKPAEA